MNLPFGIEALPKDKAGALQLLQKLRSMSHTDFTAFENYYNEHKEEVGLTAPESAALEQLHEKWAAASNITDLDYFYGMKDQHTVLNGTLINNELWRKYTDDFLQWRPLMMAVSFQIGTRKF